MIRRIATAAFESTAAIAYLLTDAVRVGATLAAATARALTRR